MISGLDEASAEVFELFAGLHEQIAACGRELDCNALASVPCPDIQAWVSRTTVDSQEVKVRVESGEDGVLLAILDEVGSGGGEQMGAAEVECQVGS